MRSINTTLISIIPVVSLMVVAVWLLGVGTLKDLALVMLVGVVCGTYSSIFFATPLLVTLRERTELVRTHTRRVLNRRKPAKPAQAAEAAEPAQSDAEPEAVAASATTKQRGGRQAGPGRAPGPADRHQDRTAFG